MIKVSIIIPVYNTEKYLRKCLDSVVNQTLMEKEIIIVNDGSTDDSLNIIEEYIKLYPYIILIDQNNKGLSGARNSGLKIATGEYIGFVDSDDIIDINMYKELYYYACTKNADMVECKFNYIRFRNQTKQNFNIKPNIKMYNRKTCLKEFFNERFSASVCVGIYKRTLFKNLLFPLNRINEDNYVKPLLIFKSKCIILISSRLYFYRKRKDSITRSDFRINNFDLIFLNKSIQEILKLYDNNNYRYYCKEIRKRNVWYVYSVIEKAIRDSYYNIKIPNDISNKYIIYILLLGIIIDAKEYTLRFFIIFSYFIKVIIYRKLHIGMINHEKK